MHAHRWLTAIVALPILILVVLKGTPLLFACLVGLVQALTFWEYTRITSAQSACPLPAMLSAIYLVGGFAVVLLIHYDLPMAVLMVMAACTIGAGFWCAGRFKKDSAYVTLMGTCTHGMIYIALPFGLLAAIHNSVAGIQWVFFILATIFAGDSAAYYMGSYFGKHKLCPNISPNKTIEGALGGILGNLVVGGAFKHYFLPQLDWTWTILMIVLMGVCGQMGDLYESMFKRHAQIKDSGVLLPGHGGFWDRVDAILFAIPVAYLFQKFIF